MSITNNQDTDALIVTINQYIQDKMQRTHLPGLSIGIIRHGEVVFLRGFGTAGPGRAVSAETPFVIGSLSKSFTALAVMQLSDADKIDLDTPVQHYLPWFCVDGNPIASEQITPRHLLTHTSGLSRFVGRELLSQGENVGMEQRIRELRKTRLHPGGTSFEYSNSNYLVLGLLVEIISGETYGDYIREHIFKPLGMHHSHISEQQAMIDGLATGYRWWFGLPRPFDAPYLLDAQAAAFLISCAGDMARWLLLHLSDGSLDGVRLLSPAGMQALHRPQINTTKRGSRAAMGWRAEQLGGESILRHGGEVSNFRADMIVILDRGLGVVTLQNCNNGLVAQLGLDQIAPNVARLLLNQPLSSRGLSFQRFYRAVHLAVILLSGFQGWTWIRALKPKRPPQVRGFIVATLIDVLAPLAVLWSIPKMADMSWRGLRLYVPDLTVWIWGMSLISFVKALMRGWQQAKRASIFCKCSDLTSLIN